MPATVVLDKSTADVIAEVLWNKVRELKEARVKAFEEHEKWLKLHPPRFGCDEGCEEAHDLAEKIDTVIETGKLLGVIEEQIEPSDYY